MTPKTNNQGQTFCSYMHTQSALNSSPLKKFKSALSRFNRWIRWMKPDVATAHQSWSKKGAGNVAGCLARNVACCLERDRQRMMSLKCGLLWSFSFVILSLSIRLARIVSCFRFYSLVYRVFRNLWSKIWRLTVYRT